ncbi:MAG: hypothetical protein E7437_07335 [Ruminococcaceae bacterium]|nr:hypothetical protein [Oscillospiraceae bacterium]
MFCDEPILKVYLGVVEDDDVYSHNAFVDCYHDIAYHCTEGYRIVLETENFAISLSSKGVTKQKKEELQEKEGEWLQNGIEVFGEDEPSWVLFETTLFVGERLRSVASADGIYLAQFDDFVLKIIPHERGDDIQGLYNQDDFSPNRVYGCERHIKRSCPLCGGTGEIYMDFVGDYSVSCRTCKKSTYAVMCLADAIENWNEGLLNCDVSGATVE